MESPCACAVRTAIELLSMAFMSRLLCFALGDAHCDLGDGVHWCAPGTSFARGGFAPVPEWQSLPLDTQTISDRHHEPPYGVQ